MATPPESARACAESARASSNSSSTPRSRAPSDEGRSRQSEASTGGLRRALLADLVALLSLPADAWAPGNAEQPSVPPDAAAIAARALGGADWPRRLGLVLPACAALRLFGLLTQEVRPVTHPKLVKGSAQSRRKAALSQCVASPAG